MDDAAAVGLCFTCRWARTVTNRRGSTFWRCLRADTDPRFARYPPLPRRVCGGFEAGGPKPGAPDTDPSGSDPAPPDRASSP